MPSRAVAGVHMPSVKELYDLTAVRIVGFDGRHLFAVAGVRRRPPGTQTAQIVGIFVGISALHIELLL
jgi:hypothetical protein